MEVMLLFAIFCNFSVMYVDTHSKTSSETPMTPCLLKILAWLTESKVSFTPIKTAAQHCFRSLSGAIRHQQPENQTEWQIIKCKLKQSNLIPYIHFCIFTVTKVYWSQSSCKRHPVYISIPSQEWPIYMSLFDKQVRNHIIKRGIIKQRHALKSLSMPLKM